MKTMTKILNAMAILAMLLMITACKEKETPQTEEIQSLEGTTWICDEANGTHHTLTFRTVTVGEHTHVRQVGGEEKTTTQPFAYIYDNPEGRIMYYEELYSTIFSHQPNTDVLTLKDFSENDQFVSYSYYKVDDK